MNPSEIERIVKEGERARAAAIRTGVARLFRLFARSEEPRHT